MDWTSQSLLVTGGTGSFGSEFLKLMLEEYHPRRIAIFSRDELKQHELRMRFDHPSIRWFIGDVRHADRLRRALKGVDIVVHAAAMKQVPACEYNPFEAIQTNVLGAQNVIEAALDAGVKKVCALSTDKAVNPSNLYGSTKLCAEKLFVQGNAYTGHAATRFCAVRYGNVMGSRGSVVPLFKMQREKGTVTLTDPRMTRFWLTLDQGVRFVVRSIEDMHGGEVFVPKIPSMRITDLAEAMAPHCQRQITGIRAGEKLHEALISIDESRATVDDQGRYVVLPTHASWDLSAWQHLPRLAEGFCYASDTNDQWLSVDDLRRLSE